MNSRSHPLASLGSYTLLGAGLGFLLLSAMFARPTGAADPVDLSAFDADTWPAIHVSHRAPTIVAADEPLDLEFDFACGYLTGALRCRPRATVWVAYGNGEYTPNNTIVEDHDSLIVHTLQVPSVNSLGESVKYYIEVEDPAADVAVRNPAAGTYEPLVVDTLNPVSLEHPTWASPETVASLSWGESQGSVGLETGPERPNTGPEAIGVSGNGGLIAVLDGHNERAVVVEPATSTTRMVDTGVKLGDIRVADDGSLTILDVLGGRSDPAAPAQLHRFNSQGTRTSSSDLFALFGVELIDDDTVRDLASLSISGAYRDGRAMSRAEQRSTVTGLDLPVYFRHDGSVLVGDRAAGIAFSIRSTSGIGPVALFERTAAGYVLVMTTSSGVDIAWFDTGGMVQQYEAVAASMWADFSPTGRVAVDDNGNIYVATTDPVRFEVLRIAGVQQ